MSYPAFRSKIVPGRLNRILYALVPASLARKIEADLIDKGLPARPLLRGEGLALFRSHPRSLRSPYVHPSVPGACHPLRCVFKPMRPSHT